MLEINGRQFDNDLDLIKYLGISHYRFFRLKEKYKDDNKSLINELTMLRGAYEVKLNLAVKLSEYTGIDVKIEDLTSPTLPAFGIQTVTPGVPIDDYLKVINYALEGNYVWLVEVAPSPFKFRGTTYTSLKKFYASVGTNRQTLFEAILKYKGDLLNAVSICENKSEHKSKITYCINGKSYDSAKEVAKDFGITAESFRRNFRKVKDADEALRLTLESKWKRAGVSSI